MPMMDREFSVVILSQVEIHGGLVSSNTYRIHYEVKTIPGQPLDAAG